MTKPTGLQRGDRVVFLGDGQRRGKHADAVNVGDRFATALFDDGPRLLCLARDLHPIPRRPPPDF